MLDPKLKILGYTILDLLKKIGIFAGSFALCTGILWFLNFLMSISIFLTIGVIAAAAIIAYVGFVYYHKVELLKEWEKERERCKEELFRCEEHLQKHRDKFYANEEPHLYTENSIRTWESMVRDAQHNYNDINMRIHNFK